MNQRDSSRRPAELTNGSSLLPHAAILVLVTDPVQKKNDDQQETLRPETCQNISLHKPGAHGFIMFRLAKPD